MEQSHGGMGERKTCVSFETVVESKWNERLTGGREVVIVAGEDVNEKGN